MKWRNTWLLLGCAAVLFAFIYFIERHLQPGGGRPAGNAPLLEFKTADITSVQLRRTNQLALRVERTNATWQMTVPLSYPAQPFAVEGFLRLYENLGSRTAISLDEIKAGGRTVADFGLDVPLATVTLLHPGQRLELQFGIKTPPGDEVYVQVPTQPGIHVVPAELFDRLPRSFNEWRDPLLLNLTGVAWNRMEVRAPGRGFAVELGTNRVLHLSKPTPARADAAKLDALLRRLLTAQVARFETDNPRADLEAYGFQAPEAELAFGLGTNDLVVVQFGASPTNDPGLVYARRLSNTNIVLVPRSILGVLQTSHHELRDHRVLAFNPELADEIEVLGVENFTVRRLSNTTWTVTGTQSFAGDPGLIRELAERLANLEGNVEGDVVTDFATYGLAQPLRQYIVRAAVTNAAGGAATNRLLAQLDVGGRQSGKIFVRSRHFEENLLYSIPPETYDRLPWAAWQLRDRQLWNFSTNQVARLTLRQHGLTRQLNRSSTGEWSLAPGSTGVINPFGIEESVHRLSRLRAVAWVSRGVEDREHYGVAETSLKLTLELRNGEKPQPLTVEFGGLAPTRYPFALTLVDGALTAFEFPWDLFQFIQPYLALPVPNPK